MEVKIIFLVFIIVFFIGVFQFAYSLKKAGVKSMLLTTTVFCIVILLLLFLAVGLISGLEALLFLYISSGALLLFSLVSIFMLIRHYVKDKKSEKIWVGLAMSCVPIFVIVLIWIFVSTLGPMKFWG